MEVGVVLRIANVYNVPMIVEVHPSMIIVVVDSGAAVAAMKLTA